MSRVILTIFLVLRATQLNVEGATCGPTTSLTCQKTDKTLGTCINGTCQCETGYFPIRSGCGQKLDKPTAQWEQGRTNEVLEGKSAVLRCSSVEGATVYEWFKNGTSLATGQTYTITSAKSTLVGNFSCKAKLTNADSYLDSDGSDEIEIKLLAISGAVSSSKPVAVVPTRYIFNNKAVSLTCTNVPMGYDVSTNVVFEDTSTPAKTISSPVNVNSSNAGSNVTCRLTDTTVSYTAPKSDAVPLPEIVSDIVNVTITGGPARTTVYSSQATVSLTCQTVPDVQYINGAVIFIWQDHGQQVEGQTSKVLVVPKLETTHVITCSVIIKTLSSSTNDVTIVMNDTYLAAPVILASNLAPFAGSRAVLTCGDVTPGAATYGWTKGGVPIVRQFDRTIQLDNFVAADAGVYTCTVTKDGFSVTSDPVTLTLSTGLSTPVITRNDTAKTFGELGDYQLICNTVSYTVGMAFVWKKCTTVLGETSRIYQITRATREADQSLYMCQAHFNSIQSALSAPYEVIISAAGLLCATSTDCPGAPAYTGACDSTTNRCTCSKNYKAVGNVCEAIPSTTTTTTTTITTTLATTTNYAASTTLPGRVCSLDSDCPTSAAYTGRCNATTHRCPCATNYLLKGEECKSGSGETAYSLIFIMLNIGLSRLF
ncbi:unnamed protein product [Lymnaea stagnalis]|uniref:Ig-like domain-containing protein n=1 Tax=Lymnaea stagnalis TaxID=6523 RepID=A0AAV2HN04_LYMST